MIIDLNSKNNEEYGACIGYFDGLHLGHQQLINETLNQCRKHHLKSALITFDPDPWQVIKGKKDIVHITPLNKRMELAKQFGMDEIMVLNFTQEVCNLEVHDFEKLLYDNGIRYLVAGFDFTYGGFGKGNASTLQVNPYFPVSIIDAYQDIHGKISSTRIENAILKGDIELANSLLGYHFQISGNVVHGSHVGHGIGFPTANIYYEKDQLLPANGVYATLINVDGKLYQSMCNIGHNPTFNYQQHRSLEINIFDFNEDIYGKNVTVYFYNRTRNEYKFDSKDALIAQLTRDCQSIREYFNEQQ